MRKTLGIIAVLLLTGCAAPTYLDTVKDHTVSAADDASRSRMGDAACKTIRQDSVHTVSDAAAPLVRGGLSQADAEAVVRAAVKYLCPDAAGKL